MPVCRKPSEAAGSGAARIAPLSRLPIFLDLEGRRAVLAGGGEAAAWKAELLAACGAYVEIFAEDASPGMQALCGTPPPTGTLRRVARGWRPDDLDGAVVALADAEDQAEAAAFAEAARARGVPVNVIDRPEHCDFQFGSIVNRAPVAVAISTDGAAPILAQAIRRRIEAVLPDHLGIWTSAARAFRTRLAARLPDAAQRRQFWEQFVDLVFSGERDGQSRSVPSLETLVRTMEDGHRRGAIWVVESGDGAADLLTLRAVRHLQAADIIVHGPSASADMLDLARREARRISLEGALEPAEIILQAKAGGRVVVLSEPFASCGEKATRLVALARAADIPVHFVPGVPPNSEAWITDMQSCTGTQPSRVRARALS